MKCNIEKHAFANALALATSAVVVKTLPAAQAVHLHAGDGAVHITADDGDTRISIRVPCADISEPGDSLVNGKRLSDIAKSMPGESIELHGSKTDLRVQSGKSVQVLKAFPLEDRIPDRGLDEEARAFTVPQKSLKAALRRVLAPAQAAFSDNRAHVAGVYFDADNGLKVVGTDGRRLHVCTVHDNPWKEGEKPNDAFIPVASADSIERALGESGDVTVGLGESVCVFSTPNIKIKTPVLNEKFPPYWKIIPQQARFFTIPRKPLLDALARVALSMDHAFPRVEIEMRKDEIEITTESDSANASEVVPTNGGYEGQIALNPRYLSDSMKVLDDESVEVSFEETAYIVSGGYKAILMPITKKKEAA